MKQYDYLIVGAGLYGAVFAQEAKKAGKKCLVIDKRSHIAGNIYTEPVEGINVHRYGAHIFHTNNKAVWQYVNQFAEFNRYTNSPVANYHGEIYNLPFNMNTFNKMWGVVTPAEAKAKIEEQKKEAGITDPQNLEEQAISLVGTDIYEKLIKGYTGKQWGRPCTELPAFIIKRLPVRFTYDDNYFNALYQGIPNGGYTAMVEKMLDFSSDCGKEIICGNYVQEERNRSIEIYQAMEPGIYTGRSLQERIHGKLLGQEKRPITMSRCMKLFSRTLIVENMKYCDPSIRMGEDMVITLPALLDAQRIVVMEGAAWYHYLFLRESMVHRYDAGMYENIRSLDKIVRQILADKHAPDAQRQADRELQLLMFLEIKNEARNGREGWKERLQKECRETELQEAVKRMPLAPTVTENKLMYQVLAHPENRAMMQLVHLLLWANSKRQR